MSESNYKVEDTVQAIEIINEKRKEVYQDRKAHNVLCNVEWSLSSSLSTEERALAWIMVAWRI